MDQPFPAYRGDEPYVFVCYAHDDSAVVYPEIEWLHDQGTNLWYDEGISAGKVWRAEIAEAIQGAATFLYYISASSLASEHCNREVDYALDRGFQVLPVYLEEVNLTPELDLALNRVQALHRARDSSYKQHLLNALGQPAEAPAPSRSLKPKGASIPAIAVLPFVNIGDTEDYFSDGVTDEILNRMIHLRDVLVISRQSSFVYKDSELDIRKIGEQLGADYILQGSVRRSGNTVRIGVRLTETADGTEMWGSSYDRELTDILRLQDEIAQAAISEFVPNIAVAPSAKPDVDPVAYDLYLRGRRAWGANDPFSAKPLLESAIAIDRNFAGAYGTLSGVYNGLRSWGAEHYPGDGELLRVLNRALELDPENVDALVTQAMLKLYVEHDLQGSISAFESLIKRFPNSGVYHGYYEVLAIALNTDEMLDVAERIHALDPRSTASAINEFNAHFVVGDFDRARRALERIPLEPVDENAVWTGRKYWLTLADIASGRFDAAEDSIKSLSAERQPYFLMWIAIEQGEVADARAFYASTSKRISAMPWYWLPLDVVLTADTSRTLDELDNRTDPGSIIWIMRLRAQERWTAEHAAPAFRQAFAALQQEPRYQQALRKYGIDDESLAKIQVHTDELWD